MHWVKMPRYMKDGDLRLRPLRIFDTGYVFRELLKDVTPGKPVCLPRLFTWWWIRKRFTCSFCIEVGSRPAGFIGLYNMKLGRSAEITLAISDGAMRRRGYGTRAFRLLERSLREYSVVQMIYARVEADNRTALKFWRSLGFEDLGSMEGITAMSLDLRGGGQD
ncbi:MAG: GNAT family N-acetyltransferase [Nitrospirae bacterium]|nr:GNAT family N-acetyltransferase [Nitrospirota bacterium]